MARPSANPDAFTEAVEWFRQRVPMPEDEFFRVTNGDFERATKIAGVLELELIQDVFEALDRAIEEGESLEQFEARVEEGLSRAWGEVRPWHIENVFRTNLQHAYARGRWEIQTDPAVKGVRPFWKFSAILDARTSPICAPLDGTVLSADDPFWETHVPPLHYQCRSTIVTLTEDQARREGVATSTPAGPPPLEGFGGAPGADDWHIDWSRYAPGLAAAGQEKLAAAQAEVEEPEPPPAPPRPKDTWSPATTAKEAVAQLREFGLRPISRAGMKAVHDDFRRIAGRDDPSSFGPTLVTRKDAPRRLDFLNQVGETVAYLRRRFPKYHFDGVKIATYPVDRGSFFWGGRQAKGGGVVTISMHEDSWEWRVRSGLSRGWRATAYELDGLEARTNTPGTTRHEFAHALDFHLGRASGAPNSMASFGSVGRELMARVDRARGGASRESWIRDNVSAYANTNEAEFFAEVASAFTSPNYRRGTLPPEIEGYMDELLGSEP